MPFATSFLAACSNQPELTQKEQEAFEACIIITRAVVPAETLQLTSVSERIERNCRDEAMKVHQANGNNQTSLYDGLPNSQLDKRLGGELDETGNAVLRPVSVSPQDSQPAQSRLVEAQQEGWADGCVGHFLGSDSDAKFSLDVTNRPLDAKISYSDYSIIIGRPVEAVADGKLKIVDYQTKEIWQANCLGNKVEIQSPDRKMLIAPRSTAELEMSGDGE